MENLNFWPAVMWQSLSVVEFLLVVFAIFITSLEVNKRKIITARLKIIQAILDGSLIDFLKAVKKLPQDVFDDAGISFKVIDFLAEKITKDDLHYIFHAYNTLLGSGKKETASIFEKAFSKKKRDFWTSLYFVNFINEKCSRLEEFSNYFEIFDRTCFVEVYTEIIRKLQSFLSERLEDIKPELKEAIEFEIKRIKILLG